MNGWHVLRCTKALDAAGFLVGAILDHRPHDDLCQRYSLELSPNNVEDLVRTQLPPDGFELVQKCPQDTPLAGLVGDQIDQDNRIVSLLVAVNAAEALLNPRRVPWDVVVRHDPAELQVDTLARRVGGHHEPAPLPKLLHLGFPLWVRHTTMDAGNLAGVAHAFQSMDEVVHGVAVLR